ncbi:hypothetical protein CCACVL1_30184 [Corchorus capsularis]|uniref:Uncharacterized protein n=1 Tax=Corchorus capsularis TaxID=210143 RepID=A0A1R3FYN1_COCAP|nr:hypothetical protein CCACVL1_30184 [Corchorus capsularis]
MPPLGTKAAATTMANKVSTPPPPPPPVLSSPEIRQDKRNSSGVLVHTRFFSGRRDSIFDRSAAPKLIMCRENGSWVHFPAEVVEKLRVGFLDRKTMVEVLIQGSKYIFHLNLMAQFEYSTGDFRPISWIDEKGMRFFPVSSRAKAELGDVNHDGDNVSSTDKRNENNFKPKIENVVNNDQTSLKKRELGDEPEVSSYNRALGANVVKRQRVEEKGVAIWPNTRLARATEGLYLIVEDHFYSGIRKFDAQAAITSIHQLEREGNSFKVRQEVFQKQVEIIKAARGTSNMVYAWYGASANTIKSVMAHGFAFPSQLPATDVYGSGMYLSPVGLPHLSANLADVDENGLKHLILCRVVLGNVEKVQAGSHQYHPTNGNFDTGSDDPNNPKWYVVWSTIANMSILPECVVSYRPGNMQGPRRPVPGLSYSFEKLVSKIKSLLPPAKIQEIFILYSTFKAQKLGRDAFLKRLRAVAGDQVLKSAILDIIAS